MDIQKLAFRRKRHIRQTLSWMSSIPYLQRVRPVTVVKAQQFAQNSNAETAGLRQLSNENNSFAVRIFWLTVIIGATVMSIFQSVESIALYLKDPSRVHARYPENSTLKLPAVTICPATTEKYKTVPVFNSFLIAKLFGKANVDKIYNLLENEKISLAEVWNISKLNIVNVSLINYNVEGSATNQQDLISVTEIYAPVGICHRIKFKSEEKQLNPGNFFLIEVHEEGDTSTPIRTVTLSEPEDSLIDAYFYHTMRERPFEGYSGVKYVARITESRFRNTWNKPCGDSESVSSCVGQCLENVFITQATDKKCRLPFMKHFNATPMCRKRLDLQEMLRATGDAITEFTNERCNCYRKCHQVHYAADYAYSQYLESNNVWWIEVNVPDNRITILEEEAAYSAFDVFADLGGCLGLWLGMCFLQVLELGTSGFSRLWAKIVFKVNKETPRTRKGRKLRVIVIRESAFNSETIPTVDLAGFRNVSTHESPLWIRILWLAISLVTFSLCIYQCTERIALYLSDPSSVNVYFVNDMTVPFPSIMICASRDDGFIPALSDRIIQEKLGENQTYHDVLLQISNGKLTTEDAWNMSGFPIKFVDDETVVEEDWKSSVVSTIVGNCLSFQRKGFINAGELPPIQQLRIFTDNEWGRKLITFYPNENLALTKYLLKLDSADIRIGYMSSTLQAAFRLTKVSYRNAPHNPCVERQQAMQCLIECLETKISLKIPQEYCRLPFMTTTIPVCNSATAMNAVLNATFSTIETFNRKDCNCFKACTEFLYTKEYLLTGEKGRPFVVSVEMHTWNRNIMVMEENSSYSAFALFSDLGGSLGLFSGICVINLFEVAEVFIFKVLIFFESRFRVKHAKKKSEPVNYHRRIIIVENSPEYLGNDKRNETHLTHKNSTDNSKLWYRVMWFVICTGMFFPFMYLFAERIQHYTSDPTASKTYYSHNNTVTFPLMLICPQIGRSVYAQEEDEPNFLDYWNVSTFNLNEVEVYINGELVIKSKNGLMDEIFSLIATSAGVCAMIIPKNPLNYVGYGTQIKFSIAITYRTQCWMAALTVEQLPLVKYLSPKDCFIANRGKTTATDASLQITEVLHRNTLKDPCAPGDIAASCVANCIERNIYYRSNVKCRLPFMPESRTHELCQTAKEYLEVKKATLSIMENFNQTDCNCARSCKSTMYAVDELKFNTWGMYYFITFDLRIPGNSITVILEENAYSFIKLLSDLGGCLGLFFGLGLIQVLEILADTATKIKTQLNDSRFFRN